MHRSTALVAVATITAIAAAGCSGHAVGRPPAPPSPTSSSPAPSSSSVAPPPSSSSAPPSSSRPAAPALSVTGVDPCRLLNAADAKALGLPPTGHKTANEVLDNAPMCSYLSTTTHLGLLLTAVPTKGLEFFGPGKVAGSITRTTVAGLPAYQNRPQDAPPGSNFCTVTVGVRAGQALDVLYREDAVEQSAGQDVLCRKANLAATDAVHALR